MMWRVNTAKENSWRLLKALIRRKKQQTVLIGSADRWLCFGGAFPAAAVIDATVWSSGQGYSCKAALQLRTLRKASNDHFKSSQHQYMAREAKWLLCVWEGRENRGCVKYATKYKYHFQLLGSKKKKKKEELPNIWYALHGHKQIVLTSACLSF